MELSRTHGPQQGAALMKRSTKHVALDVHQATTLASVREDSGRVIARSILPTEAPAIVEFFRSMRGTIHVVFEEGTQAQWLHDLLAPLVDRVVVCNRRGERQQGNKGDQVDVDELSEVPRPPAGPLSSSLCSWRGGRVAEGGGLLRASDAFPRDPSWS